MNLQILKLLLLISIILQAGCDITFKRHSTNDADAQIKISKEQPDKKQTIKNKAWIKDFRIIESYYADVANASIRKDMISHTKISKKQEQKLVVGEVIPRDIQVMPLPLVLERKLSNLPLHVIRVQVGRHVILMNVKSRRIDNIVKI